MKWLFCEGVYLVIMLKDSDYWIASGVISKADFVIAL
jgi:hypothetical protein